MKKRVIKTVIRATKEDLRRDSGNIPRRGSITYARGRRARKDFRKS